jgi:hypothetical protein
LISSAVKPFFLGAGTLFFAQKTTTCVFGNVGERAARPRPRTKVIESWQREIEREREREREKDLRRP